MKLIIDYYQFFNEYKERLTSMIGLNVSFVELLVLYSIFIDKRTQREIVDLLQKDRSQIYRLLKKLVEKKLIMRKADRYALTSLGADLSKNLIEKNEIICNILSDEVDLKLLQETIKMTKGIIAN